jgi:hypothetical protein
MKVAGDLFHGEVPPGAVYLGRPAPGLTGSPLANPHRAGRPCLRCPNTRHTPVEAVVAYADHLAQRGDLVDLIRSRYTTDTVFCCWCDLTAPCHVDVVRALLSGEDPDLLVLGLKLAAVYLDQVRGDLVDNSTRPCRA